jgi:cell division transport system permease protein
MNDPLRDILTVARNVFELVVLDALRNWARHPRTLTPALGSMTLLLLLAGAGLLGAVSVRTVIQQESTQASVLHIYLRDSATSDQVNALRSRLLQDDRVQTVDYVSKEEALIQVRSRPGLAGLLSDAGQNPLPASLQVQAAHLGDVGPLAARFASDPAADPTFPTSYDASTYSGLQTFVRLVGFGVLAILLALALVSAAVTANAIRAGIVARLDDVSIMRLVGAGGWMLRGPFVIEGALTGAVAGLLGAAVLLGLVAAAQQASAAVFTQVLPGVGWTAAAASGVLMLLAGVALGSTASLIGVRGMAR